MEEFKRDIRSENEEVSNNSTFNGFVGSKLKDWQIKEIIDFKNSGGRLNEYEKLVFDTAQNMYFLISDDGAELLKKETVEKLIEEKFPNTNKSHFMKGGVIPNVIGKFDIKNDNRFYKNKSGRTVFNGFDVNKTMLGGVKEAKEEFGEITDSNFIKQYKGINNLFMNLFGQANEKDVDYIINWLATIIQTRNKLSTALIIKGGQGSGKSLFEKEILRKIFHYVALLGNDQLANKNNIHLINKNFVVFNEIETRIGSGIDNKIKELVSGDIITTEAKFAMPVDRENLFNLVFNTNRDNAFKLDMDDRRQSVFVTGPNLKSLYNTSELVDSIREDLKYFVNDLKRYKIDVDRANTALSSEAKDSMAGATTTRQDALKTYLKKADYITIENIAIESNEVSLTLDNGMYIKNIKNLLADLKANMTEGFVTVKDISFLYKIFLQDGDKKVTSTKVGTVFNTIIGKATRKTVNGKRIMVRELESKFTGETEDIIEEKDEIEEVINTIYGESKSSKEIEKEREIEFYKEQEAKGNIMF